MFRLIVLVSCIVVVMTMAVHGQVVAEQNPAKSGAETAGVQEAKKTETANPTFYEQLQHYYEQAKESGATTTSSAAHWFAEQYELTTKSASETASSATTWVTDLYSSAVESGETTAGNAKDWVVDDISKIGTWQYKVVLVGASARAMEEKLNKLGAERWEAFSVKEVPTSRGSFLISLKRPHRSYLRQLPAKDLLKLVPLFQGEGDASE